MIYPNVAEFVRNTLATTFRRQINVDAGVTWCPQWWKHAEAISRLDALWRAWEFLRLDEDTGMSVWWRDHADHHMSVLLSAEGPFKGCSPDGGHRSKLVPLPCEEPPRDLLLIPGGVQCRARRKNCGQGSDEQGVLPCCRVAGSRRVQKSPEWLVVCSSGPSLAPHSSRTSNATGES